VPLPAGAQFLNVIESVFSGMARAIIHNSDYESLKHARPLSIVTSGREMNTSLEIQSALETKSGAKSAL